MIFWDTSALVRCYAPREPGHGRARNFLLAGKGHAASALIVPEIVSAIVRKLGSDKRNRESLLKTVEHHLEHFDLLVLDEAHLDRATRLIRHHALRAADALHLAAALLLSRDFGRRTLLFLTGDAEQASAARAERLKVLEL